MLVFIYGGSGSGKSEFAEQYICNACGTDRDKLYIATMKESGEDGKRRIQRHRDRRRDMGFITVEKPVRPGELEDVKEYVLLECVSNLLANEMYETYDTDGTDASDSDHDDMGDGDRASTGAVIVEGILNDISDIERRSRLMVVVSNDVFSDGVDYPESVREYMKALADINKSLVKAADEVYEVTAGIAIKRKLL